MDAEPEAETTIGTPAPIERISVSVPDAATILGISPSNAWHLIKKGDIKAFRLGGRTLVLVEELKRYIASLSNGDETAA